MPKKPKAPKKEYERIETFYEGENGAPWVAWLRSREVDGWRLESAMVTQEITETRFRGKVSFRREVQAEPVREPLKDITGCDV